MIRNKALTLPQVTLIVGGIQVTRQVNWFDLELQSLSMQTLSGKYGSWYVLMAMEANARNLVFCLRMVAARAIEPQVPHLMGQQDCSKAVDSGTRGLLELQGHDEPSC